MFKTLHTPTPIFTSKLALERVDTSLDLDKITQSSSPVGMISVFQKYIPSFLSDLVSIQERMTSLAKFTFLMGRQDKFEYKIEHMSPMEAAEIIISVPEGFRGNLVTYGHLLNDQLVQVHTEMFQVLGAINAYMSVFITNKTQQLTMRDASREFKDHERAYEAFNNARKVFFDARFSDVSKARLMTVFDNMKNMYQIEKVMEGMKKALARYDLETLSSKVRETSELATLLKKNIDDGQVDHITAPVMATISHGLYAAARFTELVSILNYDAQVYMSCMDKLYRQIIR